MFCRSNMNIDEHNITLTQVYIMVGITLYHLNHKDWRKIAPLLFILIATENIPEYWIFLFRLSEEEGHWAL